MRRIMNKNQQSQNEKFIKFNSLKKIQKSSKMCITSLQCTWQSGFDASYLVWHQYLYKHKYQDKQLK